MSSLGEPALLTGGQVSGGPSGPPPHGRPPLSRCLSGQGRLRVPRKERQPGGRFPGRQGPGAHPAPARPGAQARGGGSYPSVCSSPAAVVAPRCQLLPEASCARQNLPLLPSLPTSSPGSSSPEHVTPPKCVCNSVRSRTCSPRRGGWPSSASAPGQRQALLTRSSG